MEGSLEASKFTEELQWCINQLELGLLHQSPDSRQAAESIKVLKILRSKKAPMVKKRQVMRNTFGDYRKKIKEAEKKSLSGLRHSRIQPLSALKVPPSSRFLKMSSTKQKNVDKVKTDLNTNLNNLHLHFPQPGPSTSSETVDLSVPSSSQDPLTASNGTSYVNSTTFVSAESNHFVENVESSVGTDKQPDPSLAGTGESSRSGLGSGSGLVKNNSYYSTKSSLVSSKFGSQNRFQYEPSDNSFVFDFEKSDNRCEEDGVMKSDIDLGSLMIGQSRVKGSGKAVSSGFRYERTENDFCFNFDEPESESNM